MVLLYKERERESKIQIHTIITLYLGNYHGNFEKHPCIYKEIETFFLINSY